jgi:hypothetical protein
MSGMAVKALVSSWLSLKAWRGHDVVNHPLLRIISANS